MARGLIVPVPPFLGADVQPTLRVLSSLDEALGPVTSPHLAGVSCLVPGRGRGRGQVKGRKKERLFASLVLDYLLQAIF